MSNLNASNLPEDIILIIADELEAIDGNVRRSMQLNKNWRMSLILAKSYARRRTFVLKDESDFYMLSEFLVACTVDSIHIGTLVIKIKTASFFERLPFADHHILKLRLLLDTSSGDTFFIRIPPNIFIAYELEIRHDWRTPNEDNEAPLRPQCTVDLRSLSSESSSSIDTLVVDFVLPLINADQSFPAIRREFRSEGDCSTIEHILLHLVPNLINVEKLFLYNIEDSRQTTTLAFPSLPALRRMKLRNLSVDARTAALPQLEGLDLYQSSMIVKSSGGLLDQITDIDFIDKSKELRTTSDDNESAFITEPRCLARMSNLMTVVLRYPNSQQFGELFNRGHFHDAFQNTVVLEVDNAYLTEQSRSLLNGLLWEY